LSNLKDCIDKDTLLLVSKKLEAILKIFVLWESLVVEIEEAAKNTDEPVHIVGGWLPRVQGRVEVIEGESAHVDSVKADDAFFDDGSHHLGIL